MLWPSKVKFTSSTPWRSAQAPNAASAPGAPPLNKMQSEDVIVGSCYRVAQTATIYTLSIDLSDIDRGVYETLELRVARHPSETAEYMLTRVLAYCLEYTEGIAFSKGLSDPDEPAISIRDLTGALQAWIDVGAPEAARLYRASKASPRVAVYTHK